MCMGKRRLKSLQDVRRYLADVINRVEDGRLDPNLAGRVGYLVNVLRAVIEKSDLETRVAALEKQTGGKK
jgi:hypothetical protein